MNNKVSALVRFKDKVKATLYLSSSLNAIAPLINLPELPGLAEDVTETMDELNRKTQTECPFLQPCGCLEQRRDGKGRKKI